MRSLAESELDGIGSGRDKSRDGLGKIFNAGQEVSLIEEAVVDRDIEATVGLWIEETIEAGDFHGKLSRDDHAVRRVRRGRMGDHERSVNRPNWRSLVGRLPPF